MLKVHETYDAEGVLHTTAVAALDGDLVVVLDGAPRALPDGALAAVMKRFGAPLDPNERITEIGALGLGDGEVLRHVRHLAGWDVIARDYMVWERPGEEPLAALATTVAGALAHLGRLREV